MRDGSLYTGWTNDIAARLEQHRSGKGAKYTRGRGPLQLVYLEVYDTKSEAMSREARIKRFTKSEKLKLLACRRMAFGTDCGGTGVAYLQRLKNELPNILGSSFLIDVDKYAMDVILR